MVGEVLFQEENNFFPATVKKSIDVIIAAMAFLSDLVLQVLLSLYGVIGDLGLAIILFTIVFRLITYFFTRKSLRSMEKMRKLQGELKKLQEKYKGDVNALNQAQVELYQKHGINPLSGCLPQLLQFFMLIIFYQAIVKLLQVDSITSTQFLWFDLVSPDPYHIIPILAVVTQLFLSLMIYPGASNSDKSCAKEGLKGKQLQEVKQDEGNTMEMASTMQKQMMFMMPFMSGLIAWSMPSGLGLYWVISTLFSIAQQVRVSGWGGVRVYGGRLLAKLKK